MAVNPNGYIIRLVDGPFANKELRLKPGYPDPGDEIVISVSQYVAPGVLMYFNKGEHQTYEGDAIYTVRNRSQLPADLDTMYLVRGAEYIHVETVTKESESHADAGASRG